MFRGLLGEAALGEAAGSKFVTFIVQCISMNGVSFS